MKLVIQIPCYNEAETLPLTIADLPSQIVGVDTIEVLIIDDGSHDNTSTVAQSLGVDHIVRLRHNEGLARAFSRGLTESLLLGADIIVNTDGDNQYQGADIPRLIAPILCGEADVVIGDRGVMTVKYFSPIKRRLQRLGSDVVSAVSGLDLPDATSGFRAYSRDAALRTVIVSDYSYTLESLIHAAEQKLAIVSVPIRVNPQLRASRLMRSIPDYILNSGITILRSWLMYRPLQAFALIGAPPLGAGLLLGLRFLYFLAMGRGQGHVQSLILSAVLLIVGFQVCLIGLVADLVGFNRSQLQDVLYHVRRLDLPSEE